MSMTRSLLRWVVCGLVALAAVAQAEVPTADVEQVWLDPAGRGSLWVGNGRGLEAMGFRVGASLFFTQGNLRSQGTVTSSALVSGRLGVQVFGALGVTDWLELSANVPIFVYQDGSGSLGLASAGMGNPWLTAKVNVFDGTAPVALAVLLGVGFPFGTPVAQGNGGLEAMPRIQLGKVFDVFQVGGELGFLYRATVDYASVTGRLGDRVGSQVYVAGTITSISTSGPRGELSARLFVPVTGGPVGVEGLAGVRWAVGDVELFGAVGPGFFGEPTTPSVRAYFGAAFANTPLTQPPCLEGRPYRLADCPDLDRDGDGVKNAVDAAPEVPEDRDGFEDEDGAPDPDNDGDGVQDAADRCPLQRGPAENDGCPDADADGDGVVDRLDRCPREAEDADGFEDGDGCPDADNDADGLADAVDACPLLAGVPQEKGCPAKDSDGDGVFDHEDNCPQDKGEPANAGCPAAQKQLVVITATALQIREKVYFDTGRATIQKRSNALLDNVAQVLVAHPEIAKIRVEGHTDNVGKPEKNKQLSQARADAVKAYLVKKGIADARLDAVGFGDTKPAQPNDTPAGREANRRVEFNLE